MKTLRKIGKLLLIVLVALLAIPILLLVAVILLLLSPIPVGLRFRYDGAAALRLIIAFFHMQLLPKKPMTRTQAEKAAAKKAKKQEKKAKKAAKKAEEKKKRQAHSLIAKPEPEAPAEPKPKTSVRDKLEGLIPWAKLGVRFVGEFFHRRLCVRRLNIRVALANSDPAKLAMSTGRAWEILGIAVPILEQGFRIKERRLNVYPDFTAKKTDVEAELQIRLILGGLFWMALRYGFRALKLFLSRKFRKKASKTEPTEETAPAKAS